MAVATLSGATRQSSLVIAMSCNGQWVGCLCLMAALSACGVAPARDESGAAAAPPTAPVERSPAQSAEVPVEASRMFRASLEAIAQKRWDQAEA